MLRFSIICALTWAGLSCPVKAQSGLAIGVDAPDAQAIFEVQSIEKGVLLPRMTTLERDGIGPDAADRGLLIFNTTDNEFNYWDGVQWIGFPASSPQYWSRDTANGYLFPTTLADKVGIGTNSPTFRLSVSEDNAGASAEFSVTNAIASPGAFRNYVESNSNGPFTGIRNRLVLNQNALGDKIGLDNSITFSSPTGPSGTKTGVRNTITSQTGDAFGLRNSITPVDPDDFSSQNYGVYNEITGHSGTSSGIYNTLDQSGNATFGSVLYGSQTFINNVNPHNDSRASYRSYGSYHQIDVNGNGWVQGNTVEISGRSGAAPNLSGSAYGSLNHVSIDSMRFIYGTHNSVSGRNAYQVFGTMNNVSTFAASNAKYGTYNNVYGHVNESVYGIRNQAIATNGTAYGSYNYASSTGGTGYAIYSRVLEARINDDYAGYFDGRVYIGDAQSPSDGYILPIGDGASGQVIQSDGAGQASWVDPSLAYYWTRSGGNLYPSTIGDNVGIGTASPGARLQVSGGRVAFTNTTDATGTAGTGVLEIAGSLRLDGNEIITNTGTTLALQFDNDSDLSIDNTTFRVDASTNRVGVGTTTPATSLHVNHPSGNTNGLSISNALDADRWHLYTISTNNLGLYFNNNQRGLFDDASGTYTATSDARLKHNIEPLDGVLENVLQLNPVSYRFVQQTSDRRFVGMIAQEVEKVFPHLVYLTPASEETGPESTYTLDYSGLGVLAIRAIQEQQAIIARQQEAIEALNQRIQALENRR